MSPLSRQNLLRKLELVFPEPAVAAQALVAVDRYDGLGANAVKLAILKLSGGRLFRLRRDVQTARQDFRDVFFPAQSPGEYQHYQQLYQTHRKQRSPKNAAKVKKNLAAIRKRDRRQWLEWLKE